MAELKDVRGVGPKGLTLLHKLGINTIDDLVTHYPFRYEILERTDLTKANDGDKVIIDGKIESVPILVRFKAGLNKMSFRLVTPSGVVGVSIFHDPGPDPRRPASPRPGRAPGALPTFTTGSR